MELNQENQKKLETLEILDEKPTIVYDYILKKNITHKDFSLTQIANLSEEYGQKITVSYLSKLKNGKMPPPSYKITLILAKIFQRDPEIFLAASLADSDEYNRVELARALRWAFPKENEVQIKKRLEDVLFCRFINIEENEFSTLIERAVLKKHKLREKNENLEIRKVPVLSKLFSKTNIYLNEFIEEWTYEKTSKERLFYFIANDDSMKANRILKNDRVLIDSEVEVKDGDTVLLNIQEEEAVIRKMKKLTDDKVIVYTDNPEIEPIIINDKDIKVRGKIVKINISL